jgi:HEAT repeat protein
MNLTPVPTPLPRPLSPPPFTAARERGATARPSAATGRSKFPPLPGGCEAWVGEGGQGGEGRALLLALLLLLLLLLPTAAFARDDADAYRGGYQHVLDEDWPGASTAFRDLVAKYPKSDWTDDATFWLCYAEEHSGKTAEASFECYQSFTAKYPKSEWTDDAERNLVRLAGGLAQQGKPEYRDRIRGLEQHPDDEKLLPVLMALAEIGDERSLDVIFERIERTPDEQLRAAIVRVLDEAEGPAADKALRKLADLVAKDPSLRVRVAALSTLSEYDDHPETERLLREVAMDAKQPLELRVVALDRLEDFESPDLVGFLEGLAVAADDPQLAGAAIHALGEIESDASTAALRKIFAGAKTKELRGMALHAIAESEDAAAVEFLGKVAREDADPEIARFAVSQLGDFETAEALTALQQIAGSQADWRLRATAIAAIGEQESEAAVAALAAIARKGDDPRLRRAAAHALAETELDSAIQVLAGLAVSDPDPDVRRDAAHALGEIGSPAARDALIELLHKSQGR